ncbi:hypothetical protein PCANB_000336 [Pneumocystis canis]|nr:hypothetical protein PCANB_000336 [Pneumocystis canis]
MICQNWALFNVFTNIFVIISYIWISIVKIYESIIGAHILLCIFAVSIKGPMIVSNLFFTHECGYYNAPISNAFAHTIGWRKFYWIGSGTMILSQIFILFIMSEIKYNRTEMYDKSVPISSQDDENKDNLEKYKTQGLTEASLAFIIFSLPPYNFLVMQVGMTNLGFVFGDVLGTLLDEFTDIIFKYKTKKNNGVRKTEMRLYDILSWILIGLIGAYISAIGVSKRWNWIICMWIGNVCFINRRAIVSIRVLALLVFMIVSVTIIMLC